MIVGALGGRQLDDNCSSLHSSLNTHILLIISIAAGKENSCAILPSLHAIYIPSISIPPPSPPTMESWA